MRLRKTRRHNKRKTIRRKKTIRRRRGGVNNQENINMLNAEFDNRRGNLINTIQDIIDRAEQEREQPNVDVLDFVAEIRAFEQEADMIDAHFGNHDMENMLNQRIEDIMNIFGLINPNVNNHNNNETITLPNYNRNNNNNIFMN